MMEYSTEVIREHFARPSFTWSVEQQEAIFNAWLAAHDAEVKAEALREAADKVREMADGFTNGLLRNGALAAAGTLEGLAEICHTTVAEPAPFDIEAAGRALGVWVVVHSQHPVHECSKCDRCARSAVSSPTQEARIITGSGHWAKVRWVPASMVIKVVREPEPSAPFDVDAKLAEAGLPPIPTIRKEGSGG